MTADKILKIVAAVGLSYLTATLIGQADMTRHALLFCMGWVYADLLGVTD